MYNLRGSTVNSCAWITHHEIVSGSMLEFTMGPRPNFQWGVNPNELLPDSAKPGELHEEGLEEPGWSVFNSVRLLL